MSFGFSVSDFITLGALAFKLYDEFREAPGACRAFSNELLLFHQVLDKLGHDLENDITRLTGSDQAALAACAKSCEELIYVKIYGAPGIPNELLTHLSPLLKLAQLDDQSSRSRFVHETRFLKIWRQKWGERHFAARIPDLQRAVVAHIQSITALNTLIVRSDQLRIFACQERWEALHDQSQTYLHERQSHSETSQSELKAASKRLEKSNAKIERQLESILGAQREHEPPILSKSLDTSSPEGRETWMSLGRLLRAEGITPAIIKENREILVKAMKTTLQDGEFSNTPDSYHTAFESFSSHRRTLTQPGSSRFSAQALLGLLSSAPPRCATFTDEFLERQNVSARSLDQDSNVQDGMQSLLQGMETYQVDENANGDIDREGLNETYDTLFDDVI